MKKSQIVSLDLLTSISAAFFLILLVISVSALAADKIGDNSIYQYKTEPVWDPVSNKSFLFWLGKTGDIYGREYDHSSSAWYPALDDPPKNIMEYTRDPADRHNYPAVVVSRDGRILVFQSDHLRESDGYALMLYKSPNPGTIKGTWSRKILWTENQAAYPTAVAAEDSIYLFMRRKRETVWRVWQYSKSVDDGETWSEPRTIVDTEDLHDGVSGYQAAGMDEIYSIGRKFHDPVNHRIPLTWNLAGDEKHNKLNQNLYMAYLDTTDDLMYSPNGTSLGGFVSLEEMDDPDSKCLVEATEKQNGKYTPPLVDNIHHASFSDDGNFFLTYNLKSEVSGRQQVKYARWTGTAWDAGVIEDRDVSGDQYRYGSVQKTGSDDFRVSVIDENNNRVRVIETMNAGKTWELISDQPVATNGRAINSAEFVVPYKPGFPQIMVTTYPYDDKHNTEPPGEYPVIAIDY
jgi:hypothetical protein